MIYIMMYRRKVTYGDFTNVEWKTLKGLTSVVKELRTIRELVYPEYHAWICGGILEYRDTQDLDVILTGPYNPDRINFLLKEIVLLGFTRKVFIDVKYSVSGELFVPSQYNPDMGQKPYLYATYKPKIEYNNREFEFGIWRDGLWQSTQRLPLTKGWSQQDPVKLF